MTIECKKHFFADFTGMGRRFQKVCELDGVQVYDDYAHHPTEIKAVLDAAATKFGKENIVAVFQPHRYTRLKGLWEEFIGAFSDADRIIVTDVYEDELMGKCVDVDHGSGLVVSYQSLSSTLLNAGDQVSQFDVIGLAGENRYYAQLGIHAQITAHLNGQLVDPESLIDRKISEIK